MTMLAGWKTWVPLYLVLTLASGFVDFRVRAYPDRPMREYVPEVVTGTADAPGLYRVLIPFTLHWSVQATGADPAVVWHVTRLAWFFTAWVAMHVYLRTWFPVGVAVGGTSLCAALLPLTYTNSWAHPDHIPELALFTLGCLAVARGRDGWFAFLLVLATLNRETAVFLVMLYAVAAPFSRERAIRSVGFAGLWAALYGGLRLARGFKGYDMWQLGRNLNFLKLLPPGYDPYYRAYAWFGVALVVPLLYVALRTRRRQPVFVRRATWIVPAVLGVGTAFSSIIESRIFTPVLPLLVPALMFSLFEPKIEVHGSARS